MHHPAFKEGYRTGRQHTFGGQASLTDMHLVEYLQSIFQGENAPSLDESVYYTIGSFVGQMSAQILPRQADEENTQAIQDAFLAKVKHMYEATGQTLSENIRHLWALQDELAQTLDADHFVQMMKRGVEPLNL